MTGVTPTYMETNVPLSFLAIAGLMLLIFALFKFGQWVLDKHSEAKWNFLAMFFIVLGMASATFAIVLGIVNIIQDGNISRSATLDAVSKNYGVIFPSGTYLPNLSADTSFTAVDAMNANGDTHYLDAHLLWKNNELSLWVQTDETNPEYVHLDTIN